MRAYKYRIYPTKQQIETFNKHFGASRWVYNHFLALKNEHYYYGNITNFPLGVHKNKKVSMNPFKALERGETLEKLDWTFYPRCNPRGCLEEPEYYGHLGKDGVLKEGNLSQFDMGNILTVIKKEIGWLRETPSTILEMELQHLSCAYKNFFRKIKQGIAGKKGFPKFKHRGKKQSFTVRIGCKIDFEKCFINIPLMKTDIKYRDNKNYIFDGKICECTICRTPSGKYFASCIVDDGITNPLPCHIVPETTIGIDVGLKSFAVCSDGTVYPNPRFLKVLERQYKILCRRRSRKVGNEKGQVKSNRYLKINLRINRLHEHIVEQRKYYHHQISNELTDKHGTICVENLKIPNLVKRKGKKKKEAEKETGIYTQNNKMGKAILDAGWGQFRTQLKYKCEWKGKNYIEIDSFYPSSQICSVCGFKNIALKGRKNLKIRTWICHSCGVELDRDLNASINIKNAGLLKINNGLLEPLTDVESDNNLVTKVTGTLRSVESSLNQTSGEAGNGFPIPLKKKKIRVAIKPRVVQGLLFDIG